jgi:hypothetical protein
VLAFAAPMSEAKSLQLQNEIAGQVDFQLRANFFKVMHRSLQDNFSLIIGLYRNNFVGALIGEARAFLALLPVALLFAWSSVKLLRDSRLEKRWVLAALAVAVSFSPLPLHLIGWDWFRWNALAVANAFMVFMLLFRKIGGEHSQLSRWLTEPKLVMLVIMVNLATGDGLLDNYNVKTFPYIWELYQCLTQSCALSG